MIDSAAAEHLASLTGPALFQQLAGGSGHVDMPVDPNEPTYCICHQVIWHICRCVCVWMQLFYLYRVCVCIDRTRVFIMFLYSFQVSFGEMVGCDNTDCPIEVNECAHTHTSIYSNTTSLSFLVVSFCLCRNRVETERQVVLSAMHRRTQEEQQ